MFQVADDAQRLEQKESNTISINESGPFSPLIKSGVRGKYAKRYREGTNVVLIVADLHELFPDSEAVDRALRDYLSQRQQSN
jgi:hypothetical protein